MEKMAWKKLAKRNTEMKPENFTPIVNHCEENAMVRRLITASKVGSLVVIGDRKY